LSETGQKTKSKDEEKRGKEYKGPVKKLLVAYGLFGVAEGISRSKGGELTMMSPGGTQFRVMEICWGGGWARGITMTREHHWFFIVPNG